MIFLNYINSFRAISIFLIVALHTMHVFSWDLTVEQQKISYIFFGNSTSLFLFISGYLLQHLSLKFNAKRYYLSKLNYVLLPYFVISLPFVLYYILIAPPENVALTFLEKPVWLQFLSYYWYGSHAAQFWFIPVIALFYVVGPVLIWGDKNNLLYKLLPVFVMISLFIPRSSFPLYNFLHFFSIYILGMFCSKYSFYINPMLIKNKTLLMCTLLFSGVFLIEYLDLFPTFKTINYVQKILLIFTVLGLLIRFESYTSNQLTNVLANTSFGVFFLHGYVLYCVYFLSSHLSVRFNLIPGNILMLLLVSFGTLIMSTILVLTIKYVMGTKTHILIGNVPSMKNSL